MKKWIVAFACGVGLGCGSSGPRQALHGSVTLDGVSVQTGQIVFEPDVARGGSGVGGVATVRNGRYATEPNLGASSGPHLARCRFGSGDPTPLEPYGKPLCPEFTTPVTVPVGGAALDLVLTRPAR